MFLKNFYGNDLLKNTCMTKPELVHVSWLNVAFAGVSTPCV